MNIHELKTDSPVFQQVLDGTKTFEIRKADRDFKPNDGLRLKETLYTGGEMAQGKPLVYTGREIVCLVLGVMTGPAYGLQDGWAILSIRPLVAAQPGGSTRAGGEGCRSI